MKGYYKIGEFAKLIKKSPQTLRNWDKKGVFKPALVEENGRKLYAKEQLAVFQKEDERIVVGYCRVNGYHKSDKLSMQVMQVKEYMEKKGYSYQIFSDVGSALQCNRKGLLQLIQLISSRKVRKVVIVKRDSLLRYGMEIIEVLCQQFQCELECIEEQIDYDEYCSEVAAMVQRIDQLESKKAASMKRKIKKLLYAEELSV